MVRSRGSVLCVANFLRSTSFLPDTHTKLASSCRVTLKFKYTTSLSKISNLKNIPSSNPTTKNMLVDMWQADMVLRKLLVPRSLKFPKCPKCSLEILFHLPIPRHPFLCFWCVTPVGFIVTLGEEVEALRLSEAICAAHRNCMWSPHSTSSLKWYYFRSGPTAGADICAWRSPFESFGKVSLSSTAEHRKNRNEV
jgi:hypothetical protein